MVNLVANDLYNLWYCGPPIGLSSCTKKVIALPNTLVQRRFIPESYLHNKTASIQVVISFLFLFYISLSQHVLDEERGLLSLQQKYKWIEKL